MEGLITKLNLIIDRVIIIDCYYKFIKTQVAGFLQSRT